MHDVIGFGAINLDMIYEVDSLSEMTDERIELLPGREIYAESDVFSRILERVEKKGILKTKNGGGSAANTVVALSRMGFKTGFIGKVGKDDEGKWLLTQMDGVDLRGIVFDGSSGRCLSILDSNHDRSILLAPNANDSLSAEEINFHYATDTQYIHFTSFVGEKPFLAQRALTEVVEPPVRISFDPGEVYSRQGLGHIEPLLKKCFVVFVTESEIKLLTGLDFLEGSHSLLEFGPSIVVCKRGNKGVHVISLDQGFDLPAEPTRVTDNTGAGDVFDAGFLAGLLADRSLRDCASFGIRLAARSVTGYGRSHYPERRDLAFFDHKRSHSH